MSIELSRLTILTWQRIIPFFLGAILLAHMPVFAELNICSRALLQKYRKSGDTNPIGVRIDKSALGHNLKVVRNHVHPKTKICVVVKADGYGVGTKLVVKQMLKNDVTYFAAVENREIRIIAETAAEMNKECKIMRVSIGSKDEVIEMIAKGVDVEEMVGSFEHAQFLSELAMQLRAELGANFRISVHLNIDTGMGRMGIMHPQEIKTIADLPGLSIKGVMTHLAKSHLTDSASDGFTFKQIQKFKEIIEQADLPPDVIRHAMNSFGTMRFAEEFDMIRVGGVIMGIMPDEMNHFFKLKRVQTEVFSEVLLVQKQVPSGTSLGYGGEFITSAETKLAVVKLGYNNGPVIKLPQHKIDVLIGGERYPIVSSSMNLITVDISKHSSKIPIKMGDKVTIIGTQGKQTITLDEFSHSLELSNAQSFLFLNRLNMSSSIP